MIRSVSIIRCIPCKDVVPYSLTCILAQKISLFAR